MHKIPPLGIHPSRRPSNKCSPTWQSHKQKRNPTFYRHIAREVYAHQIASSATANAGSLCGSELTCRHSWNRHSPGARLTPLRFPSTHARMRQKVLNNATDAVDALGRVGIDTWCSSNSSKGVISIPIVRYFTVDSLNRCRRQYHHPQ